jgi:hypothetical protein
MSGWIKFEKDIESDPRFIRMQRALRVTHERDSSVTPAFNLVTVVIGALVRFWSYADTHIRGDDTLDLGSADIDDLIGVPGFTAAMPDDWLRVIDDHSVELPGYQAHNGVEAKKRDLAQKRQERKRTRDRQEHVTPQRDATVKSALLDQTRPDQDQERTTAASQPTDNVPRRTKTGDWFLDLKLVFPDRAGAQPWNRARKAATARIAEGHSAEQFISGAERYAAYCESAGKLNTEFVMQAATFLGPDKPFLQDWKPAETPKSRAAEKRATEEAREWPALRERAIKVDVREPNEGEDLGDYRVCVERAERDAQDAAYRRGLENRGRRSVSELLGTPRQ